MTVRREARFPGLKRVFRLASGRAGAGLRLGLLAALGLVRLMTGLHYAVPPTDLVTFASISAILIAVLLAATMLPATQAVRVDPRAALSVE